MSLESTFAQEILKLSFRKFTGGPIGSGAPEAKVSLTAPSTAGAAAAGIGAGTSLTVPSLGSKKTTRSLGSYNRVLRRAPAPAPLGKVASTKQRISPEQAKVLAGLGSLVGIAASNMLLSKVMPRARQMTQTRKLLVALGLGAGGAGLSLGGLHLMKKYGPEKRKKI
jgi:hypothetical protein